MESLCAAHLTRQSFRTYSIAKRPYTLWDNLTLDLLSAHAHRLESVYGFGSPTAKAARR